MPAKEAIIALFDSVATQLDDAVSLAIATLPFDSSIRVLPLSLAADASANNGLGMLPLNTFKEVVISWYDGAFSRIVVVEPMIAIPWTAVTIEIRDLLEETISDVAAVSPAPLTPAVILAAARVVDAVVVTEVVTATATVVPTIA